MEGSSVEFVYFQVNGKGLVEPEGVLVYSFNGKAGHDYTGFLYLCKRHTCFVKVVYTGFLEDTDIV